MNPQSPLTTASAKHIIAQQIRAIQQTESLPLDQALQRIIATDIAAPIDVPAFRNSAMDGYAVRAADFLPQQPNQSVKLSVIGTASAGHPYQHPVAPGQCVRIMTGAALPADTDSVIIQEQVTRDGATICCSHSVVLGQNVRNAGEDIAQHDRVFTQGHRLRPWDLGVLASLGLTTVPVVRKLRVKIFTSGDELVMPGEPLAFGQLYNSNAYTVTGLLNRPDIDAEYCGCLADDSAMIKSRLVQASEHADVIITTGGVSVGDSDYIRQVVTATGELYFTKLAIKPGKPLTFAKINRCYLFGLPGNPVSSAVTLLILVLPALKRLIGATDIEPGQLFAYTQNSLQPSPGRSEYQRGVLRRDEANRLLVESVGPQQSHRLHSMSRANCLLILPASADPIPANSLIEVIPFNELL